ncbi:hypothetical protein JOE65_002676 [Arthrobacter roseus]|nr:hypothetical protein [Arthrobacter roseus]
MLFAFGGAGVARLLAHLEHHSSEVGIVSGEPREDVARGGAKVCTVHVRADALGEIGNAVLAETGVSAGGACLCTIKAGGNALCEFVPVDVPEVFGIRVKHGC